MSNSESVSTQFISLEYLKLEIGIDTDNYKHDGQLSNILFEANQQVHTRILPFVEDGSIQLGTAHFIQAQKCAGTFGKALWFEKLFQVERYQRLMELYSLKIEALIQSLKVERNDKTKYVLITSDPRDSILWSPAQRDTFVLD